MQVEQIAAKYLGNGVAKRFVNSANANVADKERVASLVAGAALAGLAFGRKKWLSRIALIGSAGSLLYRGMTGTCSLYSAMGVNTRKPTDSQAVIVKKAEKELAH